MARCRLRSMFPRNTTPVSDSYGWKADVSKPALESVRVLRPDTRAHRSLVEPSRASFALRCSASDSISSKVGARKIKSLDEIRPKLRLRRCGCQDHPHLHIAPRS